MSRRVSERSAGGRSTAAADWSGSRSWHDPDEIGPWIINRSCTIVCQKGSKVDEYAQEFGFTTEYAELSEELDG